MTNGHFRIYLMKTLHEAITSISIFVLVSSQNQ